MYKKGGQQFAIDAEVIDVKGKTIKIEWPHPGGHRHRRELKTPAERARFSIDGKFEAIPTQPEKARQAEGLSGNQNARRGEHPSQVLRLPVEIVDALYECLALEGEIIDDDPRRINDFALGIISGYIRRHIERGRNEAQII